MKPKLIRIIGGIPCMTVAEHEHIVANLKREWVGLTDDDLPEHETHDFDRGVRWAERELREKNT